MMIFMETTFNREGDCSLSLLPYIDIAFADNQFLAVAMGWLFFQIIITKTPKEEE